MQQMKQIRIQSEYQQRKPNKSSQISIQVYGEPDLSCLLESQQMILKNNYQSFHNQVYLDVYQNNVYQQKFQDQTSFECFHSQSLHQGIFQGIQDLNFQNINCTALQINEYDEYETHNHRRQQNESYKKRDQMNQNMFNFDLNLNQTFKNSHWQRQEHRHYYTDRKVNQSFQNEKESHSLQKNKQIYKNQDVNEFNLENSINQNKSKKYQDIKKLAKTNKNQTFTSYLKQSSILQQIFTQNNYFQQKSIYSSIKSSQKSLFIQQCSNLNRTVQNKDKILNRVNKLLNLNQSSRKDNRNNLFKKNSLRQTQKNCFQQVKISVKDKQNYTTAKQHINQPLNLPKTAKKLFKRTSNFQKNQVQKSKIQPIKNQKQQNNEAKNRQKQNKKDSQYKQQGQNKEQFSKQEISKQQRLPIKNKKFEYVELSSSMLISLSHTYPTKVYQQFLELNRLYNLVQRQKIVFKSLHQRIYEKRYEKTQQVDKQKGIENQNNESYKREQISYQNQYAFFQDRIESSINDIQKNNQIFQKQAQFLDKQIQKSKLYLNLQNQDRQQWSVGEKIKDSSMSQSGRVRNIKNEQNLSLEYNQPKKTKPQNINNHRENIYEFYIKRQQQECNKFNLLQQILA